MTRVRRVNTTAAARAAVCCAAGAMVAAAVAMAVGAAVGGVALAVTGDGAMSADVAPEGLEKGRSTPGAREEGGGNGAGGLGGPKKGCCGRVVSAYAWSTEKCSVDQVHQCGLVDQWELIDRCTR